MNTKTGIKVMNEAQWELEERIEAVEALFEICSSRENNTEIDDNVRKQNFFDWRLKCYRLFKRYFTTYDEDYREFLWEIEHFDYFSYELESCYSRLMKKLKDPKVYESLKEKERKAARKKVRLWTALWIYVYLSSIILLISLLMLFGVRGETIVITFPLSCFLFIPIIINVEDACFGVFRRIRKRKDVNEIFHNYEHYD